MAINSYSLTAGMWGEDIPSLFEAEFDDLYIVLSGSPSINFSAGFDTFAFAEIGAKFTLDYELGFGLLGEVKLDTGEVDVDYKIDPKATWSTALETLNEKSYVDTAAFKVTSATIETAGLNLKNSFFTIDLVAALEASLNVELYAEAGIEILGIETSASASTDFDIPLPDIDVSINLAELDFEHDTYTLDSGVGVTGSFYLPTGTDQKSTSLITDSGDGLANVSTSNVSDHIASVDIDFVQVAAAIFGIPGEFFSGSFSGGAAGFYIDVDYTLLSEVLSENASLKQEFTFDADEVDVTMVSEFGPTYKISGFTETVTGQLGDKFEFETPEGEGTFKVTATYDLSGTLTLKNYLEFTTSYVVTMLGGSLETGIDFADIASISIDASLGPLLELGLEGLPFDILINESSEQYDLGSTTEIYTVAWEKFYTGTSGNDSFVMTAHQETVDAGNGNDRITGCTLDNLILGAAGNDTLIGVTGNDTLNGGTGADQLDGGTGRDTASYEGATAGVLADMQMPARNTNSGVGDTYISIENLTGSSYADVLWGDGGANVIMGGAGNDEIHGRGGVDTLVGGLGADKVYGDGAADVFLFNSLAERGDYIGDFSRGDHIGLSIAGFGITSVIAGFNFFTGRAPVSGSATPTLLYQTGTQDLYYDADGSGGGAAVLLAHVVGLPLQASHFQLF